MGVMNTMMVSTHGSIHALEEIGDTAGSYVPLVAPFEKRPFVRVETRRRRRRIVRFLIGAVAYSVLVVFVIGFLVFARQQGW